MIIDSEDIERVYVRVIDEGTELWRPVSVKRTQPYEYMIIEYNDMSDVLEFDFGEKIHALCAVSEDGGEFLVAIKSYLGFKEMDFALLKAKNLKGRSY